MAHKSACVFLKDFKNDLYFEIKKRFIFLDSLKKSWLCEVEWILKITFRVLSANTSSVEELFNRIGHR